MVLKAGVTRTSSSWLNVRGFGSHYSRQPRRCGSWKSMISSIAASLIGNTRFNRRTGKRFHG